MVKGYSNLNNPNGYEVMSDSDREDHVESLGFRVKHLGGGRVALYYKNKDIVHFSSMEDLHLFVIEKDDDERF